MKEQSDTIGQMKLELAKYKCSQDDIQMYKDEID